MNKLSKECIEAIRGYTNKQGNLNRRYGCTLGATEALTNPSIYEKAGLISLEEMDLFNKWACENQWMLWANGNWTNRAYLGEYTTAQLFQIYQEQKEK